MAVPDRIHGDIVEGGGHFSGEVDLSFSAHARKPRIKGLADDLFVEFLATPSNLPISYADVFE